MINDDLKKTERATFRAAADTGLWDILLASVFATFAFMPLLSDFLSDFWSSAILMPVCAVVYLIIRVIHTRVVIPRVGIIEVGAPRRTRLRRFGSIMLLVNLVALAFGVFAATRSAGGRDFPVHLVLSLTLLVGFSSAGFLLGIPRVFLYGVLVVASPIVGEELFQRGYASHHGWPITFGVTAAIILVGGLVRFWRVLPRRMDGAEALPQEGSDE